MFLHGNCMELDFIKEFLNKNLTFLIYGTFEHIVGWKACAAMCEKNAIYLSQFSAAHNNPLLTKMVRGHFWRGRAVPFVGFCKQKTFDTICIFGKCYACLPSHLYALGCIICTSKCAESMTQKRSGANWLRCLYTYLYNCMASWNYMSS